MLKDIFAAIGIVKLAKSDTTPSRYLRERNRIFEEADEDVARYRRDNELSEDVEEIDENEDLIKSRRVEDMSFYYINVLEKGDNNIEITVNSVENGDSIITAPHTSLVKALKEVDRLRSYYEKCSFVVSSHVSLLE